jgi:DNA-cytosine methyltransferase
MKVLSLFDGMSCGQLALKKAGINVENYYASEIDKYAIKVTQANFPNTIQLGDINDWKNWELPKIDLILGGSPCQGFSFAGKQLNFKDPRSALFFKFVDILKHYNPKYFLLENVKMKKEYQQVISDFLGLSPIILNSSLVSAQNRERLYWFNWYAKPIKDKCLLISDIYQANTGKPLSSQTAQRPRTLRNLRNHDQKASCMLASMYKLSQSNGMTVIRDGKYLRCVTPIECERLQTVPDNYTECVSNTQRYKMLGNGWTVDVIAHI